jgi:hypothetical protein
MKKKRWIVLAALLSAGAAWSQPVVRLEVRKADVSAKGQVVVRVLVSGVTNLDTYTFDVHYDTAKVSLKFAGISAPQLGIVNALDDGVRELIPVVRKEAGVVHIAATVAGDIPSGLLPGEGVLGVALLTVKTPGDASVRLDNVEFLDNLRKRIEGVQVTGNGPVGGSK